MDNKELQPHQQRVIEERSDLVQKIGKLKSFMQGKLWDTLPTQEQELLEAQLRYMKKYSKILFLRIAAFGVDDGGGESNGPKCNLNRPCEASK